MEVKTLLGWVLGERVNIPHVLCEGSSLHAVVPFEEGTTETSWTLQHLPPSARFDTLCPRWHKVDPHLSKTSDEICKLVRCSVERRWSTQEQKSKVQHHAEMPEPMFEDVSADVLRNSSLSVAGVSPMQLVFWRNPEISGDLLSDIPANQFSMTEMLDSPRE